MEDAIKIDGYYFENNVESDMYECRGDVYYDNEHDEIPEPELWEAALKLEKQLTKEGYKSSADYSEKGWVQINY